MRINATTSLLLLLTFHESQAFTIHSSASSPSKYSSYGSMNKCTMNKCLVQLKQQKNYSEEELIAAKDTTRERAKKSFQTFGQVLQARSDTFRAAGFYENTSKTKHEPLMSGAKTNITLFLVAIGYKWYRSIFINKVSTCIKHIFRNCGRYLRFSFTS